MFVNLSHRIDLNWYTSPDLNYRINHYGNFVNLTPETYHEDHFLPCYKNEGKKIGIEFTFGLKLYCPIKK